MDSLSAIFLSSLAIGFSGAASPGPMLTVTIRTAAQQGFWAGPKVVLGHAILEITTVLAIILGLGALMTQPGFFAAIGIVGGAILVWMSYGMFRSLPTLSLAVDSRGSTQSPVLGGLLTSLSNPYYILWWATAGMALISRSAQAGKLGYAAFYTGHIMADLIWYSAMSALVHFGRSAFSDKSYRALTFVLAAMLFCFGIYFGLEGVRKI